MGPSAPKAGRSLRRPSFFTRNGPDRRLLSQETRASWDLGRRHAPYLRYPRETSRGPSIGWISLAPSTLPRHVSRSPRCGTRNRYCRLLRKNRAVETEGVAAEAPVRAGKVVLRHRGARALDRARPPMRNKACKARIRRETICVSRRLRPGDDGGIFLRSHGKLVQEFPVFPSRAGGIFSTARAARRPFAKQHPSKLDALSAKAARPAAAAVRERPSSTAAQDVYILSFSQEASALLYRSRSTNAVLPMALDGFNRVDLTKVPL